MNVVLINTGNDPEIGGNANSQAYPPLGIVSLGTVIENSFQGRVAVSLLDGQVDSTDKIVEVLSQLRPDLVGISMYCTSIKNTLRIVREAKGFGAKTVLGNDHAAIHFETLLNKLEEVDFICTGDVGEETIVDLIRCLLTKSDLRLVPNLAYRIEDQIIDTRNIQRSTQPLVSILHDPQQKGRPATILDELPVPNRNLLPTRYWANYLENFKKQCRRTFDVSSVSGIATINRARGCARLKDPCRYCGIADLRPRGSSPDLFWKDVRSAREQVNANVLYEAFDSATSWPTLIDGWVAARPDDLADTRFFMYAQAAETSQKTVDIFSRMGVFCVNSGFDSGDTKALKLLKGKADSIEVNRQAACLWTDAGIEIHTSFVLMGMGSEYATRQSLDQTLTFAEWLAASTYTVSLDSAMFYPDKTAPVGSWVWHPEVARRDAKKMGWDFINFDVLEAVSSKWRNEVLLEPLALCTDFARICGVEPEILIEYNREIEKISFNHKLNFGHSLAGAEPVAVVDT